MPRCTILELEPLELRLLGVEVLLGGRPNRGLDIVVDSEGGLLGQLLAGVLCGDAATIRAMADMVDTSSQMTSHNGEDKPKNKMSG